MLYAILSLCLVGSALAQVPSFGNCPAVETVSDFKLEQYLGKWFEAQRYPSVNEIGGKCVTADYQLNDDGTVTMDVSEILFLTKDVYSLRTTLSVPDPAKPAEMKLNVDDDPIVPESDHFVLGTDYKNYAVVYSCRDVKYFNLKKAWILTRERNAPQSVIDEAIAVAEKNYLHRSIFIQADQTDC